jgi:hypothetical protein
MLRAGWETRYLPSMTIFHAFGKAGFDERLVAQEAFAHRQYLRKHHGAVGARLGIAAMAVGHALRALLGGRDATLRADRRRSSRAALRALLGMDPPPFGPPPRHAVAAEERPVGHPVRRDA